MKIIFNTIEKLSYAFFISMVMSSEIIEKTKKSPSIIYSEIHEFFSSKISNFENKYHEIEIILISSKGYIDSIVKIIGV